MKEKTSKKWSLRTRITWMVLGLLLISFLLIFIIFNATMDRYIERSVVVQLDVTSAIIRENPEAQKLEDSRSVFGSSLNRQPRNLMGVRARLFVMGEDYSLWLTVAPDETEFAAATSIAEKMQARNIALGTTKKEYIETSEGKYYISSMKVNNLLFGISHYLVFYADVTDIKNFAERVNLLLLIIMGIAAILAVIVAIFLSGSIARPVKILSDFARQLGAGKFKVQEHDFKDAELSDLLTVMNQAAEQLDTYDKDQKTFFQNVSHELRTPLMSIRCYAEGIGVGVMDKDEASQVILAEADRLSGLVEDLLYISRIDSITSSDEMAEHDLRELLSNSAQRQMVLAEKQGLNFAFDFDPEPIWLLGNNKHLERAFDNLISNALRYAYTTITFRCHRTSEGISVTVEDDGQGIDPVIASHIFERFFQGQDGKHGIGLAIVKSVVENHQGKVEAISEPGQGARFILTFAAKHNF